MFEKKHLLLVCKFNGFIRIHLYVRTKTRKKKDKDIIEFSFYNKEKQGKLIKCHHFFGALSARYASSSASRSSAVTFSFFALPPVPFCCCLPPPPDRLAPPRLPFC